MQKDDIEGNTNSDKVSESSVKRIVRKARGSLTQQEFVAKLHQESNIITSQGLISKYETGQVNPPTDIIDACMNIIQDVNIATDVSLDDLELKIRRVLTGPSKAQARKAFAVILDRLA